MTVLVKQPIINKARIPDSRMSVGTPTSVFFPFPSPVTDSSPPTKDKMGLKEYVPGFLNEGQSRSKYHTLDTPTCLETKLFPEYKQRTRQQW